MVLYIGYQKVLAAAVPGQAVWFGTNRDFVASRIRKRVHHENLTSAASGGEHEPAVALSAQHAAAFGTPCYGSIQLQALTIDDFDSVVGRVRHEDSASVEMYVAVVEIARDMGWQCDVSAQGKRHSQRPDN